MKGEDGHSVQTRKKGHMHYLFKTKSRSRIAICLLLTLIGLTLASQPAYAANAPATCRSSDTINRADDCHPLRMAGKPPTALDTQVQQVLTNMSQHAWNPAAQTNGQTTGGLYINWKMDDPLQTNAGNTPTSHDPLVDLAYVNALAEYKTIHPQDSTYNADLQRILPLVTREFYDYSVPKGWVYFTLLRDGTFLQNSTLVGEAYLAAYNFYTHWYDAARGTFYNHNVGNYNVGHILNCGAALIDAGIRWNMPAWVQAGRSTLDHTLAYAVNPRFGLVYENMTVQPNGTQQVSNYQAKANTQGAAVTALVIAYTLTRNMFYWNFASLILHNLFNGPLWDTTNGGLFFAIDTSSGQLQQVYKETRGQTQALIALYRYNSAALRFGLPQAFLDKQQQLLFLLSTSFYQPTYHGFFYRVTPTFQIYTSSVGQGIGYENYFTTEAMGTALDALQQIQFPNLTI